MYVQIMKKYVDVYCPGKIIPKVQLVADFIAGSGQRDIPMFRYRVKLIGAKEPHNMLTIWPTISGEECLF